MFMTAAERATEHLLGWSDQSHQKSPGQFAFADADRVSRILTVAGWRDPQIVPLDVSCTLSKADLAVYVRRMDPVGGPSFEPLTASMARGGILLEYGALSSEPTPFPLFTVLGKSLTLKGFLYTEVVADDAVLNRAKAFIIEGLTSGALKPKIARTSPFDQIQEAHRFLETNEQIGKVVVTV